MAKLLLKYKHLIAIYLTCNAEKSTYLLQKRPNHRIRQNQVFLPQGRPDLDELGSLYLSIGITELYNFTNTRDLQEIGLIDKEGWETLSSKNQQELPVYLANKMIEYIKENKKVKEMSNKWNIKEGEIRKHITKMTRYITEGIIDVIE